MAGTSDANSGPVTSTNIMQASTEALNNQASSAAAAATAAGESNIQVPSMTAAPSNAANNTPPSGPKVVEEFQYLLEKSQHLFSGLRDLPAIGGPRIWQPFFQKTFEVYTKLWKFQQENRATLENKEFYGLKRWEIGEIASKIGQLYYHYYLRTSETNYLQESFVFYEAIRERNYFKDVLDQKKKDTSRLLMEELNLLVKEYNSNYKPSDSNEWEHVLQEISTFLDADKSIAPVDYEGITFSVSSRLKAESQFEFVENGLRVQEAIICATNASQIKFSELTLDMFRILQTLEREPIVIGKDGVANDKGDAASSAVYRFNPHKYLLFRPTFSQLYTFLTNGFKELSGKNALFIYISAEGALNPEGAVSSVPNGYNGGILTSFIKPEKEEATPNPPQVLSHCLHPMDIVPFTRRPLFLVVESNQSGAYSNFPKTFAQPLMCLLSPTKASSQLRDSSQVGSIFTLFLNSFLLGISFSCKIGEVQSDVWKKCISLEESLVSSVRKVLLSTPEVEDGVKLFMQDECLSNLICRFVLFRMVVLHHVAFKDESAEAYLPQSYPALPASIYENGSFIEILKEVINALNLGTNFDFK